MSAYDNSVFQRPTSLLFTKYGSSHQHPSAADEMMQNSSGPINNISNNVLFNSSSSNNNDVFGDEQEDQIVPDCSVAPKLDLSPMNDCWTNGANINNSTNNSHGFLTTAVHLSLQEVSSTLF